MRITDEFLTDPELIQIDKQQATVSNIAQSYVRVAKGAKKDALLLLLRYYGPKLAIVFCNTKKMVDELSAFLNAEGFSAESIHGDINQGQRTRVMTDFKSSKTTLLVATDVAARASTSTASNTSSTTTSRKARNTTSTARQDGARGEKRRRRHDHLRRHAGSGAKRHRAPDERSD